MAPCGDAKLFFCILFITCCCTVTLAQIPMDCCLTVKNKEVAKALVADYRQQISGQGCAIDATILVTRNGRTLCVPADELWVQKLTIHVEKLKKLCKRNGYKGKRCNGVKPE
uniref:Chemokine interleukin-8-like domain-containing protein n=1 Tax=Monopterus albus TaxID=43700 RepID=A0A3Q3J2F2_MONAL|nr:C-C motif chemokine 19-like [Monopterus albus]